MVVKLPYLIPSSIINKTLTPTDLIKGLIMGYAEEDKQSNSSIEKNESKSLLLAATNTIAQAIVTQQ